MTLMIIISFGSVKLFMIGFAVRLSRACLIDMVVKSPFYKHRDDPVKRIGKYWVIICMQHEIFENCRRYRKGVGVALLITFIATC